MSGSWLIHNQNGALMGVARHADQIDTEISRVRRANPTMELTATLAHRLGPRHAAQADDPHRWVFLD